MPYLSHKFKSLGYRQRDLGLEATEYSQYTGCSLFGESLVKIVPVAKLADVPPGTCRSVEADGIGVAICNVAGTVYILDNTCPHAGGPLGEGSLDGELIECPWHGWRYNVRTGERPENPEITVSCFQVHVENDIIHVLLPNEDTSQSVD
jgi:nitrite reductase/ring-hydroxylating ferredoxin subunit